MDSETRKISVFNISEDRTVVRHGLDAADERTIVIREHARIGHVGTLPEYPGTDHTTHGATEYLGRFLAQDTAPDGRVMGQRVLHFLIPARTLFLAFQFLDDAPAVAAAVAAAVALDRRTRQQLVSQRSIILPGGNT